MRPGLWTKASSRLFCRGFTVGGVFPPLALLGSPCPLARFDCRDSAKELSSFDDEAN